MRHWRFVNVTFFSFILWMNSEAAITSLAQVIITRYEKIKIERADFCQKSMKYHPGVACQRRSIYCIVRGRGAHCRKLRERKGGGLRKWKRSLDDWPNATLCTICRFSYRSVTLKKNSFFRKSKMRFQLFI